MTDHAQRIIKPTKSTPAPGLAPIQVEWFLAHPQFIKSERMARAVRITAAEMGIIND